MASPINLREYEAQARERLPQMVYDYFAGGANDEQTIAENEHAWGRVHIRPRALVDVSAIDLRTTVVGHPLEMPILTAPCSFNKLAHADGEIGVARATAAAGIIQVISMQSTTTIEEIASSSDGRHWFQMACLRDREVTRALVQRAEAAGYSALCLTVDVPVLGRREREIRNRFHLPEGIGMVNLEPYIPVSLSTVDDQSSLARFVNQLWDASLTWEAVDWLCSITTLPVLAKGVLSGEDARLAVEHGAAGIIVSNHGGRQLDGGLSTCEALPEVVEAIAGRVDVLVDGGIRRGTDIVRALALGARAVLIGRPYLWGLAVDGEAGVGQVLALLRAELELAMALVGRANVNDLEASLIA